MTYGIGKDRLTLIDPTNMTSVNGEAIRAALLMLEQIAKRSSDASSRALADGAAADLRAVLPARFFDEDQR